MEKNLDLDSLMLKEGKVLNEQETQTIEMDDILKKNNLPYDTTEQVLPGAAIAIPTADDVVMNENEAHDNIIKYNAMNKLAKEQAEFKKLSDDEKIKDTVCKAQYYRETNDFYHKYGYEMTGKQKRALKRAIEIAWKKGKIKLTDEQKENILYDLNKASQQMAPAQAPTQTTESNISGHIKDLNSLIFK